MTIELRRIIDEPPTVVFAAYRDVDRRVQWLPEPGEVFVLETGDFRSGGVDRFQYESRRGSRLLGVVRYEAVDEARSLVYILQLTDANGSSLASSIISWRFDPRVEGTVVGTEITYVEQTTSLVGSRPIEGRKYRASLMLDRLAAFVGSSRTAGS